MVIEHRVRGYDDFVEYMKRFKSTDLVHVYFSGNKLPSGESWCSDCVTAWPVIQDSLNKADEHSHFVYVEVGDRPTWKDPNCKFRKDLNTKLMVLPTLMRWNRHKTLSGDQCKEADLVEMLLTDED